jgi:hypothetical protein
MPDFEVFERTCAWRGELDALEAQPTAQPTAQLEEVRAAGFEATRKCKLTAAEAE